MMLIGTIDLQYYSLIPISLNRTEKIMFIHLVYKTKAAISMGRNTCMSNWILRNV